MRSSQFAGCCGAFVFYDLGYDDDWEEKIGDDDREELLEYLNQRNKYAVDLLILNEFQERHGVSGPVKEAGFVEVGPRVINDNSGAYIQVYQRVNGKVKGAPKTKKKSAFNCGKKGHKHEIKKPRSRTYL